MSFEINHHPVVVRAVDVLKGKKILIYMLPLNVYHIHDGRGLCPETLSLIAEFKDRDFDDVEVVFVSGNRGPAYLDHCALNRFNDFFSMMTTWLAVPFSDRAASRRIQEACLPAFPPGEPDCLRLRQYARDPAWAMVDPDGTVLLTSNDIAPPVFASYGLAELFPRARKILPLLVQRLEERRLKYGPSSLYLDVLKLLSRHNLEDKALLGGITGLDRALLGYPSPEFLLSSDGSRVPLSALEGKVVGLYFCNQASSRPSRMDSIRNAYAQAAALGYGFEIVQINFNYTLYVDRACREIENVPWLTMPYIQSCCKRLIRIFRCYNYEVMSFESRTFKSYDEGDRLVIIDPKATGGVRYSRCAAPIIDSLGIQAYPFTQPISSLLSLFQK